MSDGVRGKVRAPEFPASLEWLNMPQPLTLAGLRGKVVLLDFWTFCCINCQHVLPELRKIEERFPEEVVVIGVHSAKFPAEGETYNIRQAVMRHDIRHPVVNDHGFLLWRAYAVKAWPTLVIVDPEGRVVGAHSGEFNGEALGDFLAELVQDAERRGKLDRAPLHTSLEKHKQPETLLSFPGKVLADPATDQLFVADTNHHRVLRFRLRDGRLLATYGTGDPGRLDATGRRARLHSPQGMALVGEALYVADTENHAIRKIALETSVVLTVGGTGEQAAPLPVAGPARSVALNSPWDLEAVGENLFVAMAGSHQIWALHLPTGQISLFAGDGRESLVDGPPAEARLAQPSGLSADARYLWFVDSETSSVRSVPLSGSGEVKTWVGHGLFEFGDLDGARAEARLQHPLGISVSEGLVYVADAYNNRIKVLDPIAGEITTLAGSGEPGLQDGPAGEACFWEPGGLCAAGRTLYVADTNNHAIRIVDSTTGLVRTLELEGS